MTIGPDDADLFARIDQAAGIVEQVLFTERFVNSLDL